MFQGLLVTPKFDSQVSVNFYELKSWITDFQNSENALPAKLALLS